MSLGRSVVLALATSALGCAEPTAPVRAPSQLEWTAARARLDALRAAYPTKPFVEQVTVAFREPGTGKLFEGRGAVAVLPRQAMRMILVGPGGTTALDAWVTPTEWRFAVPPLKLVQRGGRDAPAALPIGFFRWWFLRPYDGRLLTLVGRALVLDDGAGVVQLDDGVAGDARRLVARRRHGLTTELLTFHGALAGAPAKGDRAEYQNPSTGLAVDVTVDELGAEPPDPAAFVDPEREAAP
jgi:hypothetical protein